MKISYADYIKKTDVSVLIAEAIFSELEKTSIIKTIADVANTSSGGTPLRSNFEFYGGDVPWIKSGELNDGIIENAEEFITKRGLDNSSAKLLPENTLLLAMYGATAGRTGITKIKASTNQAVCALFPKDDISQEYLFWFLRQYRYKFIEISKGGAQPNISQTVINNTPIPIPEKKLQKQITDILHKIEKEGILDISIIPTEFRARVKSVFATKNNVFEIDAELTHQLSLVKKLRQQLLQDAVQGKLVPQNTKDKPASELLKKIKAEKQELIAAGKLKKEKELPPIKPEEIPFEIPEGWVWCRLGEVIELTSGQDLAPHEYSDTKIKGLPYITGASNLQENQVIINRWTETPKSFAINGDLLLTCKGSGIGKMAYLSEEKVHIARQIMAIRTSFISLKYIETILRNNVKEFRLNAKSLIPGIDRPQVLALICPLPPLSEQTLIVQKLDSLMRYCDELEASIKESQVRNERLLREVLREALRVG